MKLRHIEIFHAVMQCGTVNGAAQLVHITQPAASRLLQQAERHSGLVLFRRERGRLVPTQEALALRAEVEQLYLQLESIHRLAEGLRKGPGGMLRVLCVPSLSDHWLTHSLADLKEQFPQAQVSFRAAYSRPMIDSLALREADIGFAFEASTHPAVHSVPIANGEMVAYGAVDGDEMALDDLPGRPVIDLDPTDPIGRLLHRALSAQGLRLNTSVLTHNYHTATALARRGLGLALVDSFTGRLAAATGVGSPTALGLRCVPVRPGIPVSVYALRPQGVASSALVEHLIEDMRRRLHA